MKHNLLAAGVIALCLSSFTQINSQAVVVAEPASTAPIFHVVEINRSIQAVNYEHNSGSTKVDFAGTELMPGADGHAKVDSKRGTMAIGAEFAGLSEPTSFGNEYLTYVMWAISPEGRAFNLGEVLVGGNSRSKLTVTTSLQSFALIVTAEPYFAVRQPSNVVVLENIVRDNTKGTTVAVKATYTLMERDGYLPTGYKFDPLVINQKLPLEFFEARNAMRIAKSEGADMFASESYQHAAQLMSTADSYAVNSPSDTKRLIAASRETVQTAEDSRTIAVKKMDDIHLADERAAAADAQAAALARVSDEANKKQEAQADLAATEAASKVAINASQAQAAEANRKMQEAQADTQKAETDAAANQAAAAAALTAAESDKAILRARLIEQLNVILMTRDSARGLIISMSDVLFDTGRYTIKPGAREKLAKVAGILLAYPSLNIAVGGYTDNVGSDATNQTLSENRAGSVRDYLLHEGVASASVTATGFGDTLPVTSNDSSAGRQQNRRVELVVSGDAIGTAVNATIGSVR